MKKILFIIAVVLFSSSVYSQHFFNTFKVGKKYKSKFVLSQHQKFITSKGLKEKKFKFSYFTYNVLGLNARVSLILSEKNVITSLSVAFINTCNDDILNIKNKLEDILKVKFKKNGPNDWKECIDGKSKFKDYRYEASIDGVFYSLSISENVQKLKDKIIKNVNIGLSSTNNKFAIKSE